MTEQERFDRCLTEVLRLEGGYVEDERDPGGATRFGVTRAVLGQARGRAASAAEVAGLSAAEAADIYRSRYWAIAGCGRLPPGLDLLAFDMAVNMGPETSARLLQTALGIEADGLVGPRTVARAQELPVADLIRAASELRRRRYRALPGFKTFGRGWLRRVDAIEGLALAWSKTASAPEAPSHQRSDDVV